MGCDIHAILEIESGTPEEFDSLFGVQFHLPRHHHLFGALAGVRGDITPLYPRRGIPHGLGAHGFSIFYREIVSHMDALGYRGSNIVLPYEVGRAKVLTSGISERWGASKLGYIINEEMEGISWLLLHELRSAIVHPGLSIDELPKEYGFLISTMSMAEVTFNRATRIVFWFDNL